jgi:hypothetical protein
MFEWKKATPRANAWSIDTCSRQAGHRPEASSWSRVALNFALHEPRLLGFDSQFSSAA